MSLAPAPVPHAHRAPAGRAAPQFHASRRWFRLQSSSPKLPVLGIRKDIAHALGLGPTCPGTSLMGRRARSRSSAFLRLRRRWPPLLDVSLHPSLGNNRPFRGSGDFFLCSMAAGTLRVEQDGQDRRRWFTCPVAGRVFRYSRDRSHLLDDLRLNIDAAFLELAPGPRWTARIEELLMKVSFLIVTVRIAASARASSPFGSSQGDRSDAPETPRARLHRQQARPPDIVSLMAFRSMASSKHAGRGSIQKALSMSM